MEQSVLKLPAEVKELAEPLQALITEVAQQVRRGRAGRLAQYEAFETATSEQLAAVERTAHGLALSALDLDVLARVAALTVPQHRTAFGTPKHRRKQLRPGRWLAGAERPSPRR